MTEQRSVRPRAGNHRLPRRARVNAPGLKYGPALATARLLAAGVPRSAETIARGLSQLPRIEENMGHL